MVSKKILLDTHIFIWWMDKSNRLPKNIYTLINDPKNQIFVSVASIWEIVIKKRKSEVKLPKNILEAIKSRQLTLLPIEITHVLGVESLPLVHKDPFDRILISQAKTENLTLITSDEKIHKYNIKLIKV